MTKFLTLVASLTLAASVFAGDISHRVVVADGESVAGVPGETFRSFSFWTITPDGKVVFFGQLTANRRGIWIETSPGQIEKIGFKGEDIIGDGHFLAGNPDGIAVASGNNVAFSWTTVDGTGNVVRDSLFLWRNGQIQRLAAVGENSPIAGTQYASLSDPVINATGQVAFTAILSGTGVTSSNNRAAFIHDGLQAQTIVRSGEMLGGFTLSSFDSIALSSDSKLFLWVSFAEFLRQDAIYQYTPGGGLALIVADKSPPTGTDEFTCCFQMVINRVGQVATSASYRQDDDWFTSGMLLFRGGSGGASELYKEKRTLENGQLAGEISFTNNYFLFDDFGNLWSQGQRAVTGEVDITRYGGGSFTQLMIDGTAAPGTAGTLLDSNLISLNGVGQVTVLSGIDDNGTLEALYVIEGETPKLVFKQGDNINIGTDPPQAVTNIAPAAGNPANGVRGGISLGGAIVWAAVTENARRTIMVSEVGPPPLPSIDLEALEVTQGIQNLSNDMPLYAGKETYVRAYLNSSIAQQANVVLRAYDVTESELPGSPIRPLGGLGELGPQANPDRNNTGLNPLFRLPPEWADEIIVTLEIDRLNGGLNCQEDDGTNGDCTVDVVFDDQPAIPIRFLSLNYAKGGVQQVVSLPRTQQLAEDLLIGMPTSSIDWNYAALPTGLTSRPNSTRGKFFADTLRLVERCYTNLGCKRLYYGVILSDGENGLAALPGKTGAGWSPADRLKIGRHTHTHEVGHNLTRPHSVDASFAAAANGNKKGLCGSQAASTASDFPNYQTADGLLRPLLSRVETPARKHYYGFDPVTRRVADPRKVYDMMSYCSQPVFDLWASDHTYRQLIPAIAAAFSTPPSAAPFASGPNQDYLFINGMIDLANDVITIEIPRLMPDSPPPDVMPDGSYTARLLGSGDQILDSINFEPQLAEARGGQSSLGFFSLGFVYNPAAIAVEVDDNNGLIQRLDASANAPLVEVISPNGGESLAAETINLSWTASDADNDDLLFTVLYSPDTINWHALALDIEASSIEIPRSSMPGGNNTILRVLASDGFNVGFDDNDSPFEVIDNPPSILIVNPLPDQVYVPASVVELSAVAMDPENGLIDASALNWSSDLDGPLGTSSALQLAASDLTVGQHLLTASLNDPDTGMPANATVSIEVLANVPANTADLQLTLTDVSSSNDPSERRLLLSVENLGDDTAMNVTARVRQELDLLQPALSASWSIVSSSGLVCTIETGIDCSLSALGVGESAQVTFDVTSYGPGLYQFNAEATHGGLDPWSMNNKSSFGAEFAAAAHFVFSNGFE